MRTLTTSLFLVTASIATAQPRLAMPNHAWEVLTEGTHGYQAEGGITAALPTALTPGDLMHDFESSVYVGTRAQVVVDVAGACPTAQGFVEIELEGVGPSGAIALSMLADPNAPSVTFPALFDRLYGIASASDSFGNTCDDMNVSFFAGQQQEISYSVVVTGLDEIACTNGSHQVLFNGRFGVMTWDPTSLQCAASIASLYFPARAVPSTGAPGTDAHMWTTHYPTELLGAGGDVAVVASGFDQELSTFPYRGMFFGNDSEAEDVHVRPLLIELGVSGATLDVVDRARVMFWENARGDLVLKDEGDEPAASASLSVGGLEALEGALNQMNPYPSLEAFNTQLAASLRSAPWNVDGFDEDVLVRMSDMNTDHQAYFESGTTPAGTVQWEGSAAYEAISSQARRQFVPYSLALNVCRLSGRSNCRLWLAPLFCVRDSVGLEDFFVRIHGMSVGFSADHDHRIVSAGDVDLQFRDAPDVGIAATKILQDLDAMLEGDLLPHVTIEYKRSCALNVSSPPTSQRLDSQVHADDDPLGWARCTFPRQAPAMSSSTMYGLVGDEESLIVEDESSTGSWTYALPSIGGTCAEPWMDSDDVEPLITAWDSFLDGTTRDTWALHESDALDRLLAPFEIGHTELGTAPLFVHEHFEQRAIIGMAEADRVGLMTSSVDGLYVPYLTQAVPLEGVAEGWQWPCFTELGCKGEHASTYPSAGVDPMGSDYDVAIELSHVFLNQILWAQAHQPTLLGSIDAPVVIADQPHALRDVVGPGNAFLDAHPEGFEMHVYATRAPFVVSPDGPLSPATVTMVVPQVIVELYSTLDTNVMLAQLAIDILDREFVLRGIDSSLWADGVWSTYREPRVTTLHIPSGCSGVPQGFAGGCEGQLAAAVGAVMWQPIMDVVRGMVQQAGTPGIFDAGGTAPLPLASIERPSQRGGELQIGLFGDLAP